MRNLGRTFKLASTVFAFATLAAAAPASAAPILGSHVDAALFSTLLGSSSGWSYAGQSVGAFSGGGTATLVSRDSSYGNTFGTSNLAHEDRAALFGTSATAGTSVVLTGPAPSYLFYFAADGDDFLFASDDNRQYSDGFASGGTPGRTQGDMDIFFNAASSTWAFFFDDAGGTGLPLIGDDNDYNDLVVTFRQTTQSVPEPGSLALMGLAMIGFASLARRRAKVRA